MSVFTPINAVPSAFSEVTPAAGAVIATVVEFVSDYVSGAVSALKNN